MTVSSLDKDEWTQETINHSVTASETSDQDITVTIYKC